MLARYGWAASLTRDGLERMDVLAMQSATREMVEVHVKTVRSGRWMLGRRARCQRVAPPIASRRAASRIDGASLVRGPAPSTRDPVQIRQSLRRTGARASRANLGPRARGAPRPPGRSRRTAPREPPAGGSQARDRCDVLREVIDDRLRQRGPCFREGGHIVGGRWSPGLWLFLEITVDGSLECAL
jgi:hypothetical protein